MGRDPVHRSGVHSGFDCMRSLGTSGIKAILAVAALSTGIHWALRLQRNSDGLTTPAIASIADPEMTGSISPRASAPPTAETRQAVAPAPEAPAPLASRPAQARAPQPPALDHSHLAALIATAPAPAPVPKKTAKR